MENQCILKEIKVIAKPNGWINEEKMSNEQRKQETKRKS